MNGGVEKVLFEYGGSVAIIGALIFFLYALTRFISALKNGNDKKFTQDISSLNERIEQLERNHFRSLEERVYNVEKEISSIKERLAKIEAKLN
jgi:septal ring factor EnvC (AmiA/AmiB activator)